MENNTYILTVEWDDFREFPIYGIEANEIPDLITFLYAHTQAQKIVVNRFVEELPEV